MAPSAKQTKLARVETAAKILLLDVESFPNEGWTWAKWEQNVIEFTKPRMICSIAWQWYPSREKFVMALPDFPGYDPKKRNNLALMQFFKKELDKADLAIGHNIDDFDNPMLNTDLVKNGLQPPPPHRTIDTLKICRSRFRFNSSKLDDVCQELGIGEKVKHPGFAMWKGCMEGDSKSWDLMRKYNVGDIDPLLRGLYERLRPWMKNHPNMNIFDGRVGCPTCGGTHMIRHGWNYSNAGKSIRFRCKSTGCGKTCTGKYVNGAWVFK